MKETNLMNGAHIHAIKVDSEGTAIFWTGADGLLMKTAAKDLGGTKTLPCSEEEYNWAMQYDGMHYDA